jgi:hypothetical protein
MDACAGHEGDAAMEAPPSPTPLAIKFCAGYGCVITFRVSSFTSGTFCAVPPAR